MLEACGIERDASTDMQKWANLGSKGVMRSNLIPYCMAKCMLGIICVDNPCSLGVITKDYIHIGHRPRRPLLCSGLITEFSLNQWQDDDVTLMYVTLILGAQEISLWLGDEIFIFINAHLMFNFPFWPFTLSC